MYMWQGEGTWMARGGIRLIHRLTKSTLIMYFSGMKIDPKYTFLHAFFLICLLCPFKNLYIWPKAHTLFSNFTRFCTLNDVHTYIAWSWKTTLIAWFFGWAWYPLDIRVPPQDKWKLEPLQNMFGQTQDILAIHVAIRNSTQNWQDSHILVVS